MKHPGVLRSKWGLLLAAICVLAVATLAADVEGKFSLFGNSKFVTGGLGPNETAVDLTSNCGAQPYSNTCSVNSPFVFSGVAFNTNPNKLPTLNQLTILATDYNMNGTDCSGGSPRFVIFTNLHNYELNIGQAPFGGNCYYGWQNTGNVASATDPTPRWQVDVGNTFFKWSDVLASHGSEQVTEVDIVLDGGWIAPRGQDVTVDNFTVNDNVFPGKAGHH
ncbi:MAG TPA: hypothetical protein VKR82_02095 [Candidatus Acidoferrales bacterium]|nr:hypothetical protein [Candidatus Acidoferrales bacterium]